MLSIYMTTNYNEKYFECFLNTNKFQYTILQEDLTKKTRGEKKECTFSLV